MPSILDTLSPDELSQLFGAENIPERQRILQEQLGQARGLASQPQQHHTTGLGAALGALAGGVGGVAGAVRASGIRDQQNGLLDQLVKAKLLGARAGSAPMSMNTVPGVPQDPLAQDPAAPFSLTG